MKVVGGIILALIFIPLQGYAVFWWRGGGVFFSQTGLESTVIPAFIEFVVAVVSAMHYDRIHATSVSNPHSLIGQSLRNDARQGAATQSSTRGAWDGQFTKADDAADQMSGKP